MQYAIEHPEKMNSLVLIGTQYEMPKYLLKNAKSDIPYYALFSIWKNGFSENRFYQSMQIYDRT